MHRQQRKSHLFRAISTTTSAAAAVVAASNRNQTESAPTFSVKVFRTNFCFRIKCKSALEFVYDEKGNDGNGIDQSKDNK